MTARPWQDASRPPAERVELLLGEMTLEEKLAQLGSVWIGADLGSGDVAPVAFRLHADRTAFTGIDLRRIVEPGEIHVMVGASSADIRARGSLRLTGEEREAGRDRVLDTPCSVAEQAAV